MDPVTVLTKSTTTQNVAMAATGSAGGIAGILYAVRAAWPDIIPWPVEADAAILAALTTTVLPWLSRKIAFIRDKRKAKASAHNMSLRSWLPLLLCVGVGLQGCATNGISVAETTPDGGTFRLDQSTMSTVFAQTQEGSGTVNYTGTASDGSGFSLQAGAGVIGQQGGDPTALVTSILNIIAPLIAASQAAQEQAPTPPAARDAELAEIRELLELLMEGR
jgi:hypothetical protein